MSGESGAAPRVRVAVIGAGPAGLMAADRISAAGHGVAVYEAMPSAGRKLLMAGRGGLNLTHSEPLDTLLDRYGAARDWMGALIARFSPDDLRAFALELGQETFVGSSGRIFPRSMKASPLLRAWLGRLADQGVAFHFRHRWRGIARGHRLTFETGGERVDLSGFAAVVIATGGASWPRLGANGDWVRLLEAQGVGVAPLEATNAGVVITWSEVFAARFAGTPLKRVRIGLAASGDPPIDTELVVTRTGLEGSGIYALSPGIRAALRANGRAELGIDLRRDLGLEDLTGRLAKGPGKMSMSNWLRKAAGLPPVAIGLLREVLGARLTADPAALAGAIKGVRLEVRDMAGLDRAISTAGGVRLDEIDDNLMLRVLPGVFVAGEILNWDAPTGGYLLQGVLASGAAAGDGVVRFLASAD
ncbi:MAG: NAD(P)/FAD-dependent oxidoreductase [Hyphomicrobiaceae bacterium]